MSSWSEKLADLFWNASVLLALATCQCAHSTSVDTKPPAAYRVILDSTFAVEEREAIARGADAWATAIGPDISFEFIGADPASIKAGLNGDPKPRTIYVLKVDSMDDVDCLLESKNVACFKPPSRIYLAAPAIYAINAWDSVPAHEFGHAIGLPHLDYFPSCMQEERVMRSKEPQSVDVQWYCALPEGRGCPNRIKVRSSE